MIESPQNKSKYSIRYFSAFFLRSDQSPTPTRYRKDKTNSIRIYHITISTPRNAAVLNVIAE